MCYRFMLAKLVPGIVVRPVFSETRAESLLVAKRRRQPIEVAIIIHSRVASTLPVQRILFGKVASGSYWVSQVALEALVVRSSATVRTGRHVGLLSGLVREDRVGPVSGLLA